MKNILFLLLFIIPFLNFSQQVTFNNHYAFGVGTGDLGKPIAEINGVGYLLPTSIIWIDSSTLYLNILDYYGNLVLTNSFTFNGANVFPSEIIPTSDNNFLLIGGGGVDSSNTDFNLIYKISPTADTLWTRKYFSPNQTKITFSDVIETKNNELLIVGHSAQYSGSTLIDSNVYLLRTDNVGNVLWDLNYGNSIDLERGISALEFEDSSIVVCGDIWLDVQGINCGYILKFDKNGTYINELIEPAPYSLTFVDCVLGENHNFFVAGSLDFNFLGNIAEGYLAKVDSSLNIIWFKTLGHPQKNSFFQSMIKSHTNELIMCGTTDNLSSIGEVDGWLVSFDTTGTPLWERTIVHSIKSEWFYEVIQSSDMGFVMCGSTATFDSLVGGYNQDVWVVKVDSLGCDIDGCPKILSLNENIYSSSDHIINIYPNPFATETNIITNFPLEGIILSIFNSVGQEVKQIENLSGKRAIIKRDNLLNGLYFIRFTKGNLLISAGKIIINNN